MTNHSYAWRRLLIVSVALPLLCLPAMCWAANCAQSELTPRNKLDDILPYFEQYAQQAMREWRVPGMAIAIVKDNKVVYLKGFGKRDYVDGGIVDENTVFQIGSIAKGFSTVLLAQLVDTDELKWQHPVRRYLPSFTLYDDWISKHFSIEDLLTQRSGLPPYAGFYYVMLGANRSEAIHALRYLEPVSEFRDNFSYQNILYLVAAAIAEKLTGQTWETLIQEKLFTPLNMHNASTNLSGLLNHDNTSSLHRVQKGKITRIKGNWPYHQWVYTFAPATGINASAADLAQWLILHTNQGKYGDKQLVSAQQLNYMHSPKNHVNGGADKNTFYGLSWFYQQAHPCPIIWHGGQTSGSRSIMAFIPQEKLGIVVLTNLRGNRLPAALAMRFFDQYYGTPPKPWSKGMLRLQKKKEERRAEARDKRKIQTQLHSAPLKLPLKAYTGQYYNPVYGVTRITLKDNKLHLIIGPKKASIELHPVSTKLFTMQWPKIENYTTRILFVMDKQNDIKGMVVEKFAKEAGGKFVRIKE